MLTMCIQNRIFWLILSFLTFGVFVAAISFHIYWLNIFVIISGTLINKCAPGTIFTKKIENKKTDKQFVKFQTRKNYKS
jgi:hypothetical protein